MILDLLSVRHHLDGDAKIMCSPKESNPAGTKGRPRVASNAFPSTAFREPILQALQSKDLSEGRSGVVSDPFPSTAFRKPIRRMLAQRMSKC
jgi:hypothetical protein